jgi:hypothetical protein
MYTTFFTPDRKQGLKAAQLTGLPKSILGQAAGKISGDFARLELPH